MEVLRRTARNVITDLWIDISPFRLRFVCAISDRAGQRAYRAPLVFAKLSVRLLPLPVDIRADG